MYEKKLIKGSVKVSSESDLSVRLSVLESKVDRILSILAPADSEESMSDEIESAIVAHLRGDRGPIEELERRWAGISK